MGSNQKFTITLKGGAIWDFQLSGGGATPLKFSKVRSGSNAQEQGLQKGDTLVSVNDVNVRGKTQGQAMDLIGKSKRGARLVVTRGDEEEGKADKVQSSAEPQPTTTTNEASASKKAKIEEDVSVKEVTHVISSETSLSETTVLETGTGDGETQSVFTITSSVEDFSTTAYEMSEAGSSPQLSFTMTASVDEVVAPDDAVLTSGHVVSAEVATEGSQTVQVVSVDVTESVSNTDANLSSQEYSTLVATSARESLPLVELDIQPSSLVPDTSDSSQRPSQVISAEIHISSEVEVNEVKVNVSTSADDVSLETSSTLVAVSAEVTSPTQPDAAISVEPSAADVKSALTSNAEGVSTADVAETALVDSQSGEESTAEADSTPGETSTTQLESLLAVETTIQSDVTSLGIPDTNPDLSLEISDKIPDSPLAVLDTSSDTPLAALDTSSDTPLAAIFSTPSDQTSTRESLTQEDSTSPHTPATASTPTETEALVSPEAATLEVEQALEVTASTEINTEASVQSNQESAALSDVRSDATAESSILFAEKPALTASVICDEPSGVLAPTEAIMSLASEITASVLDAALSTSRDETSVVLSATPGDETSVVLSATPGDETSVVLSATAGDETSVVLSSTPGDETSVIPSATPGDETSVVLSATAGVETSIVLSATPGDETSVVLSATAGDETSVVLSSTPGDETSVVLSATPGDETSVVLSATPGDETSVVLSATPGDETSVVLSATPGDETSVVITTLVEDTSRVVAVSLEETTNVTPATTGDETSAATTTTTADDISGVASVSLEETASPASTTTGAETSAIPSSTSLLEETSDVTISVPVKKASAKPSVTSNDKIQVTSTTSLDEAPSITLPTSIEKDSTAESSTPLDETPTKSPATPIDKTPAKSPLTSVDETPAKPPLTSVDETSVVLSTSTKILDTSFTSVDETRIIRLPASTDETLTTTSSKEADKTPVIKLPPFVEVVAVETTPVLINATTIKVSGTSVGEAAVKTSSRLIDGPAVTAPPAFVVKTSPTTTSSRPESVATSVPQSTATAAVIKPSCHKTSKITSTTIYTKLYDVSAFVASILPPDDTSPAGFTTSLIDDAQYAPPPYDGFKTSMTHSSRIINTSMTPLFKSSNSQTYIPPTDSTRALNDLLNSPFTDPKAKTSTFITLSYPPSFSHVSSVSYSKPAPIAPAITLASSHEPGYPHAATPVFQPKKFTPGVTRKETVGHVHSASRFEVEKENSRPRALFHVASPVSNVTPEIWRPQTWAPRHDQGHVTTPVSSYTSYQSHVPSEVKYPRVRGHSVPRSTTYQTARDSYQSGLQNEGHVYTSKGHHQPEKLHVFGPPVEFHLDSKPYYHHDDYQHAGLYDELSSPDSFGMGKQKKVYSDSAFYDTPEQSFPTITEQMNLCKKIAQSLTSVANRRARGAEMFLKRQRKSSKWIHEGFADQLSPSGNVAYIQDMDSVSSSDEEDFEQDPYFTFPEYTKTSNPTKMALTPVQYEQLRLYANKCEHNAITPELCFDIVADLKAHRGRGGRLFERRRKRSDKFIIDDSHLKASAPSTKLDSFISQPARKDLTPWEAAMTHGGNVDAAFSSFSEWEATQRQPQPSKGATHTTPRQPAFRSALKRDESPNLLRGTNFNRTARGWPGAREPTTFDESLRHISPPHRSRTTEPVQADAPRQDFHAKLKTWEQLTGSPYEATSTPSTQSWPHYHQDEQASYYPASRNDNWGRTWTQEPQHEQWSAPAHHVSLSRSWHSESYDSPKSQNEVDWRGYSTLAYRQPIIPGTDL